MDFNIRSFLEKFKNITPPDDFLKKVFISAVLQELRISIEKSDIKIRNKTIYVSAPPVVKNELYIKKPLILKRVCENLKKSQISDIR